jgi:hypothetical protein
LAPIQTIDVIHIKEYLLPDMAQGASELVAQRDDAQHHLVCGNDGSDHFLAAAQKIFSSS